MKSLMIKSPGFSLAIKKACTYPGADVFSDHVLRGDCHKNLCVPRNRVNIKKTNSIRILQDPNIKNKLSTQINMQIQIITTQIEEDIMQTWTKIFKDTI